ncbi:MAG: helix-turn-helix transcriptional regulator [Planctomycetes bacterium]|nr:helix-turn-helix transcriptional regulator [Planctomycetota bacterium]
MSKRCEFLVSTVAQMEALASPIRHQIHLAMEMLGPCSVNELAERMGRVPETLYYHVRRLEKVGILAKVGTRDAGMREEAIYRLQGKRLRVDPRQTSPRFLKAMAKGCGSLLRFAQRSFEQALEARAERRTVPKRSLRIEQVAVRLSARNLVELNNRLDGLQEFLSDADEADDKQMYVITVATAPL